MPDDVVLQTKPQIALAQISAGVAVGVPTARVLTDAKDGIDTTSRDRIIELGLTDVVGIQSHTSL